jgi:hypothetical protein
MIDDVVLLYGETKLPADDCKVIFKDKSKKEQVIEVSRLIEVFNNHEELSKIEERNGF